MNKAKKFCPIMAAGPMEINTECEEDRCAWFHLEYHPDGDYTSGACALVRIADSLRQIAKSQTSGNLGKETAAGAADTDDGKQGRKGAVEAQE